MIVQFVVSLFFFWLEHCHPDSTLAFECSISLTEYQIHQLKPFDQAETRVVQYPVPDWSGPFELAQEYLP
jgi:hypothetical protein